MYELIQAGENSFYIDCPSKVGIYRVSGSDVVLIDSGNDKDCAKKIKRVLDSNGWKLQAIYNTHSHADHIGGNHYLQNLTGCKIYAPGIERAFTEFPVLEPAVLYGGFPLKELNNKFIVAKESVAENLTDQVLPEGLDAIRLPGHTYDMVGYRTKDDVIFLADSILSAEMQEKHRICVLYDIRAQLETLESIKNMKAVCFVPSHVPRTDDIAPLAQLNINKTLEIADNIMSMLSVPKTFETLLAEIFDAYGLVMTLQKNMLISSTVRSYLSYLRDLGKVEYFFEDNRMLWKRVASVNETK